MDQNNPFFAEFGYNWGNDISPQTVQSGPGKLIEPLELIFIPMSHNLK